MQTYLCDNMAPLTFLARKGIMKKKLQVPKI
jgi:hypothetical protein